MPFDNYKNISLSAANTSTLAYIDWAALPQRVTKQTFHGRVLPNAGPSKTNDGMHESIRPQIMEGWGPGWRILKLSLNTFP